MNACMYVCIYVYMYACVCVCFEVGVQKDDSWMKQKESVYTCTYVCACVCTFALGIVLPGRWLSGSTDAEKNMCACEKI